jgi:hypothetical protein
MRRALLSCRLPALALMAAYGVAEAPAAAQSTNQTTGSGSSASEAPGQGAAEATGQIASPSRAVSDSARTTTYAEATVGAGYSSNPSLQATTRSSAFGRASLTGYRVWNGDRGTTILSGYVENTTYVRGRYGSKQIFRVFGRTDRALSERVRVFGTLSANGDIAGQLSNRFGGPVGDPSPEPNPEVINLTGRQYLVRGQAGASITTSPLSSVSLSAGASHAFFTGGNETADYTTYQGTLGYGHQLSERSSVGANVSLQRQQFRGDDYSDVVNLAGTFSTKFAEDISANGSVGILAIYIHRAGLSDHSYSPSFSASVCKAGERTQYCAYLSRSARAPLAIKGFETSRSTAITTDFGLSYNREFGQTDTFRANLTGTNSSRVTTANEAKFRTTYVTGLASYDRRVGRRLYVGLALGARRLFQTGPDPKTDYNGNFYLRYRLGDLI